MEITGIDHLYVETASWDASVTFWEDLGFEAVERWGSEGHRAGRFTSNAATVVLAEVTDREPTSSVFFAMSDPDDADLPSTVTPLEATHWGTRWIRVKDPDGRVHSLEEPSA